MCYDNTHMGIVEHPRISSSEKLLPPWAQRDKGRKQLVDPGKSFRCRREIIKQEPCMTIIKPMAWQDGSHGDKYLNFPSSNLLLVSPSG